MRATLKFRKFKVALNATYRILSVKTKVTTLANHKGQRQVNQSKLKVFLLLIGRKIGASFLSKSCRK